MRIILKSHIWLSLSAKPANPFRFGFQSPDSIPRTDHIFNPIGLIKVSRISKLFRVIEYSGGSPSIYSFLAIDDPFYDNPF